MSREELDIISRIVEIAYSSDDFVEWIFVEKCEEVKEQNEIKRQMV